MDPLSLLMVWPFGPNFESAGKGPNRPYASPFIIGEFIAHDSSLPVWEFESRASAQTQCSYTARISAYGQKLTPTSRYPAKSVEEAPNAPLTCLYLVTLGGDLKGALCAESYLVARGAHNTSKDVRLALMHLYLLVLVLPGAGWASG